MWHEGDPWGPRSIVLDGHRGRVDRLLRPAGAGRRRRPRGRGRLRPGRGGPRPRLGHRGAQGPARRGRRGPAYASAPASCPTTRASIRVLAKCGFTELRGSNEDGELVMARPLRCDAHGWSPPTSTARWSAPTAPSPPHPRRPRRLVDRGVPVVFVTGRPLRWAEEVFEHGRRPRPRRGVQRRAGLGRRRGPVPELRRGIDAGDRARACRGRAARPRARHGVRRRDAGGIGLEPAFMERTRSRTAPGGRRSTSCRRPGPQAAGPARGARAAGLLGDAAEAAVGDT